MNPNQTPEQEPIQRASKDQEESLYACPETNEAGEDEDEVDEALREALKDKEGVEVVKIKDGKAEKTIVIFPS